MRLTTLTDEVREQLSLDASVKGVAVLTVDETSDAFEKGMRSGDLISEVGQKPVTKPKDVADAFKAARDAGRKSVLMLVKREGAPRFVALTLGLGE